MAGQVRLEVYVRESAREALEALRRAALARGCTLNALVCEALVEHARRLSGHAAGRPPTPPVAGDTVDEQLVTASARLLSGR